MLCSQHPKIQIRHTFAHVFQRVMIKWHLLALLSFILQMENFDSIPQSWTCQNFPSEQKPIIYCQSCLNQKGKKHLKSFQTVFLINIKGYLHQHPADPYYMYDPCQLPEWSIAQVNVVLGMNNPTPELLDE